MPLHAHAETPADEAPKGCHSCADWATPRAPFQLFGDAWYVGPEGLSVLVVKTADGLVLLDGALPETVPLVAANLDALGLSLADVKYILVSHAHFDHVGGVAALQRRSGAVVVTTAGGADDLRAGRVPASDPQAGFGAEEMSFPPVMGEIRTLGDGETLTVGGVGFTQVATPGHTPNGASWTWESCDGGQCARFVYADSLNPVAADGYDYSDHPEYVAAFQASIAKIAALDCDVLVSVHPSFSGVFARAARAERRGQAAFLAPHACEDYAADAAKRLKRRLADEG